MNVTMARDRIYRYILSTCRLCMCQLCIGADALDLQPCREPPRSLRLGWSRCGKAVIKRVQTQAVLEYAEREQSRP